MIATYFKKGPLTKMGKAVNRVQTILACERQTYFRLSLLSLRNITSVNPTDKTISMT